MSSRFEGPRIVVDSGEFGWVRTLFGSGLALFGLYLSFALVRGSYHLFTETRGGFGLLVALVEAIRPLAGFLILCAPALGMALLLLGNRSGMWIDLDEGEFTSWKQFLWRPKTICSVPLANFHRIVVAQKKIRHNKRTRTYRAIYLCAEQPFKLHCSRTAIFGGNTTKAALLYLYQDDSAALEAARELGDRLDLPVESLDGGFRPDSD